MVWQGLALLVDNKILLATPFETAVEMVSLFGKGSFYVTIGKSVLRIGLGFGAGVLAAIFFAACSFRVPLAEEILAPVMTLAKAVPVATFAVLLLIWWGSSFLAVAVSFLVVLPNLYISILEGLKSTDVRMLEMAQVFRLPLWNRFFYIYRPALKPFVYSSIKLSLGMCWKSGVAAEVIGTPKFSIGEQLYLSKLYLDTGGIFAWTAVVILLSLLFQHMILRLLECFLAWEPVCKEQRNDRKKRESLPDDDLTIRLQNIRKAYDGQAVLEDFSAVYRQGECYYLTSPSGSGKTTLLHLLAALISPDTGQVTTPSFCSMVFQEDRLCEDYSAVKNVEMITGSRERAEKALCVLLDKEALEKPCRELSGGMKRRVALIRAMEAEAEYILLDEPFVGMDKKTCELAEQYIRQKQNGRTIIMATHIRMPAACHPSQNTVPS